MEAVGFVFSGLIQILVIVGIVVAVVALVRRRGGAEPEEEPGIGTLRRLFYYGLAFVALMVAAAGVTNLVDYVADRLFGPRVLAGGEGQLAMAMALTVVGTPIWLLFWILAQRSIRQFPWEERVLSRKVYIYLVLGVSAALAASGLVNMLSWLLGVDDFNGVQIAFFLVLGGVWAFHWRIETLEGQTTELARSIRRLYAYVTSLYGLTMLTIGISLILGRLLSEAYDSLFGRNLLLNTNLSLWDHTVRMGLCIALVGGLLWWWHWCRVSRNDTESVLRQVYLFLFTIMGGALTVVVALSILIYSMLQWLIGEPSATDASAHFRSLPGVIATLTIGVGVWRYHWAVVQQEAHAASEELLGAGRVYRYIMAALGLGTLATALVIMFSTVLGILVPEARERLVNDDWWRNPLTLSITLMAVGAPVWTFYWFGAQRETEAVGTKERVALSRRVFIYLVFGIAVLVNLGNLSALLYMFFRDILESQLSTQVLQDAKWSIGMLLMAVTISVYYWLVLQEDRRAMPAPDEAILAVPRVRKVVIALASEGAQPFVRQLELRLGTPIRMWQRLDARAGAPTVTEEDLGATVERITEAPGQRVLLDIDGSDVRVIPYREM
jgi:hypothetical protein